MKKILTGLLVLSTITLFGCGKEKASPNRENARYINEKFDLTPRGIINYLDLQKPIYKKTTNYGHFGKKDLPWEKIIKF